VKIERVVIFGHKPVVRTNPFTIPRKTHTHSYIHAGYKRAFEYLGFETLWLDSNSKNLENIPLRGTLFFTEGQVDENIPISLESGYITHNSNRDFYQESNLKRLHLCNYVADLQERKSFNFPGGSVQKIDSVTFVDVSSKALYQPWATNLLPNEILPEGVLPSNNESKIINYVGTVAHDNIMPIMKEFRYVAKSRGVDVKIFSGVSDERARQLVSESLIAVDIRGDWHQSRGYVPCRIWKNMSYGLHVGSNSVLLETVFEGRITISKDPRGLFENTLSANLSADPAKLRDNMNWVREKHTFVQRAQQCLLSFKELA
jgi:hypothetical protein